MNPLAMKSLIIFFVVVLLSSYSICSQKLDNKGKTIKILSFNILHGTTTRGDFDLDAIAKVIIEADPDFMAI